jgi:hypothetical protein
MQKKRTFEDVWDVIDISVYILVGYALLDLFFSVSTYISKAFPAAILGIVLMIIAYGSIGYIGRKEKLKQTDINKSGAYAGLIIGLASAIIGIISFYVYPEKIADAIMKAVEAGADAAMVQTVTKIMTYVNLVLSPAINAGLGALIALISGNIFKKKFEEKMKK